MRLAVISDIHEDYLSLQKILLKAEAKGYDQLICLGDISGFSQPFYKYRKSRDASACLHLLREKCEIIIPGNHDLHLARRIPEHSAIFDFPKDWYELPLHQRTELTKDEIWLHEDELEHNYTPGDIAFLNTLSEFSVLNTPELNILLSHYAFPNLSGFKKGFYSWEKEFSQHFEFMQENDCSLCFTGHAHPRGFYIVHPDSFKQYRYRGIKISDFPAIVGIPPVTRHKHRTGFCIFDTDQLVVRAHK
ncbi:MAG: metallophosphoesterase [Bacteroidales bacterium]|nr:metallophosphoesterase [Bacteroidales bacterium]